jgi:hypothetical protein
VSLGDGNHTIIDCSSFVKDASSVAKAGRTVIKSKITIILIMVPSHNL